MTSRNLVVEIVFSGGLVFSPAALAGPLGSETSDAGLSGHAHQPTMQGNILSGTFDSNETRTRIVIDNLMGMQPAPEKATITIPKRRRARPTDNALDTSTEPDAAPSEPTTDDD